MLRDAAPEGAPCWIDLFTSDVDRSRTFYGELFGWKSTDAGEEFGHYINFTKDDVAVAGAMANDGSNGTPDMWTVYLATTDVAATTAAAVEHGGQPIVEPMPIADLGHMAVLADAGGAAIGAWQGGTFNGFGVVNETNAPSWFELHTRDFAESVSFYEAVFGWDTHSQGDSDEFRYTTLGEGDGQLAGVMDASSFLPDGVPAHWAIYFGTDDADATVARTIELGGQVLVAPEDTPYGRLATCADATGAMFRLLG
jgi:uncharacterized protein